MAADKDNCLDGYVCSFLLSAERSGPGEIFLMSTAVNFYKDQNKDTVSTWYPYSVTLVKLCSPEIKEKIIELRAKLVKAGIL